MWTQDSSLRENLTKTMETGKYIKVGRKKIWVSHDNFEYYQPNTHECGDCAIRAITKVTGLTWRNAYIEACNATVKDMYTFNETAGMKIYLKEKGFEWVAVSPARGESRPTVAEFAKSHPDGKYVLLVSNHFVAAQGGKYYDIWDSGDKSLYGYWVKK